MGIEAAAAASSGPLAVSRSLIGLHGRGPFLGASTIARRLPGTSEGRLYETCKSDSGRDRVPRPSPLQHSVRKRQKGTYGSSSKRYRNGRGSHGHHRLTCHVHTRLLRCAPPAPPALRFELRAFQKPPASPIVMESRHQRTIPWFAASRIATFASWSSGAASSIHTSL